jgi:hypothetical protein
LGSQNSELDGGESLSAVSSVLSVFHDNSLEALKSSLAQDYHRRLVLLLNRYSYIPPKVSHSDVISTGGPYIDLGLLEAGAKIKIDMQVTNCSADELYIEVTARDFESDDIQIKTFPKPIYAGLTKYLALSFTVHPGTKTVLASVDIVSAAKRNGLGTCVSCPVFYRVDSSLEADTMPRCTSATIQDLLGQFCPGRERKTMGVSFEMKKNENKWNLRTLQQFSIAKARSGRLT